MSIYIDDEPDCLSPETSHPRFVELAPESFYYEWDSFGPFGSDTANDALRALERWYVDADGAGSVTEFLADLLDDLALEDVADVLHQDETSLLAWMAEDDDRAGGLWPVAEVLVATALGQLKIAGTIDEAVHEQACRGARVLRVLVSDACPPDWPHRTDALAALDAIEQVLDAAQRRGAAED